MHLNHRARSLALGITSLFMNTGLSVALHNGMPTVLFQNTIHHGTYNTAVVNRTQTVRGWLFIIYKVAIFNGIWFVVFTFQHEGCSPKMVPAKHPTNNAPIFKILFRPSCFEGYFCSVWIFIKVDLPQNTRKYAAIHN